MRIHPPLHVLALKNVLNCRVVHMAGPLSPPAKTELKLVIAVVAIGHLDGSPWRGRCSGPLRRLLRRRWGFSRRPLALALGRALAPRVALRLRRADAGAARPAGSCAVVRRPRLRVLFRIAAV